MAEYDNTDRGSIWKNPKKEKDTHPDFTGTLNVGGVEYWVSAWKRKEGASPKAPALTFQVKPKDEQKTTPPNTSRQASGQNVAPGRGDMDDEIPFAPETRI
jgi:hypothetical protein